MIRSFNYSYSMAPKTIQPRVPKFSTRRKIRFLERTIEQAQNYDPKTR